VLAVGKLHFAVSLPSQVAPQVGSVPALLHFARLPCGTPVVGEQVPTLVRTSHAWHWPVHVVSQHTPSTQ
jgi:hypothetical protein